MADTPKITRNVSGSIGNVFGSLFGNVFAWLWFSALLIVVGAFVIFAPIATVGKGGRSVSEIVAVAGGFLLVGAGVSWVWHRLDEKQQRIAIRIGESLAGLIVFAAIAGVATWSWWSWDVPDIWNRPLTALTLGDIAQNILKLGVLFLGVSFVSGVLGKLFAYWRHG